MNAFLKSIIYQKYFPVTCRKCQWSQLLQFIFHWSFLSRCPANFSHVFRLCGGDLGFYKGCCTSIYFFGKFLRLHEQAKFLWSSRFKSYVNKPHGWKTKSTLSGHSPPSSAKCRGQTQDGCEVSKGLAKDIWKFEKVMKVFKYVYCRENLPIPSKIGEIIKLLRPTPAQLSAFSLFLSFFLIYLMRNCL